MKIYRPLWSEGVLLSPQQFQQQAEWESFSRAGLSLLSSPFPWGVERAELNDALLASGRVQVQTLRLWLPDGTLIDTQNSELPPEPREVVLPDPARADSVIVLVALPVMQPGIVNVQAESVPVERPLRYREEWVTVQDAFGQEEEPIAVARFNIMFRFDSESNDAWQTCAIARLLRDGAGWLASGSRVCSSDGNVLRKQTVTRASGVAEPPVALSPPAPYVHASRK